MELSRDQWQQLADKRVQGQLTPAQEEAWQRSVDRGLVPPEMLQGIDPAKSTLSAATPAQVTAALQQPPLPPEPGTWGQTALEYGLPTAFGLASKPLGPLGNAAVAGGSAGLGYYLAHAPFLPPDPRTDPIGAYQMREAATKGTRRGLEVAGATLLPGAIPKVAKDAGTAARLAMTGVRAGAAATGAAAGSVAAEPLDPSADPVGQATQVGTWTGIGQMVGEGINAAAQKGLAPFAKTLTEWGAKAADTLKARGLAIPASTTDSTLLKMFDFLGEESIVGGTKLRQARTSAERNLTQAISETLDQAKLPRTPVRLAQLQAQNGTQAPPNVKGLYTALDDLVSERLAQPGKPVPILQMRTAAQDLQRTIAAMPTAHQATPEVQELLSFARGITALPEGIGRQQLEPLLTRMQLMEQRYAAGVPQILSGVTTGASDPRLQVPRLLQNLRQGIEGDLASPLVIQMRPLQVRLQAWAGKVAPWLPPEIGSLIKQVDNVPSHLSFEEAKDLRSALLAIGRGLEGGGQARVPTAAGQRPVAGTGGRFAPTLQAEAQSLAKEVDAAMARGARRLGPEVEQYWRQANAAMRVQSQAEWLHALLTNPGVQDPTTGLYKGSAILRTLAGVNRPETLEATFAPGVIANIKKFANALDHVQQGDTASPGSGARWLLRRGVALAQGGLGASAYALPTPIAPAAAALAITPTALGIVLQSPRLSNLLIRGLTLPEGSREASAAMGRLIGVLQSQGLTRTQEESSPAPEAVPTRP